VRAEQQSVSVRGGVRGNLLRHYDLSVVLFCCCNVLWSFKRYENQF
jgi:hypothetical protein